MSTPELIVRPLLAEDAVAWHAHIVEMRTLLQRWEPRRPDSWYEPAAVQQRLEEGEALQAMGLAVSLALLLDGEIAGRVTLTNVVRGVFQCADLGYHVAPAHWNRGLATVGVRAVLHHAFGTLQLHRLQAGVMPHNTASLRVLEKCGFRREGLALRYLLIDDAWEDHILLATTAEEHQGTAP